MPYCLHDSPPIRPVTQACTRALNVPFACPVPVPRTDCDGFSADALMPDVAARLPFEEPETVLPLVCGRKLLWVLLVSLYQLHCHFSLAPQVA
ncbi:hypothetical protein D3C81_1075870 [compost metagenome]